MCGPKSAPAMAGATGPSEPPLFSQKNVLQIDKIIVNLCLTSQYLTSVGKGLVHSGNMNSVEWNSRVEYRRVCGLSGDAHAYKYVCCTCMMNYQYKCIAANQ